METPAADRAAAARAGTYPLHPSLAAKDGSSSAPSSSSLQRALSLMSRTLDCRASYDAALGLYQPFLAYRAEQSMMHGATPAFNAIMVARQKADAQKLPVADVHAFSEREEEINEAAAAYRAHGIAVPEVKRLRIRPDPERLRLRPGGMRGAAAAAAAAAAVAAGADPIGGVGGGGVGAEVFDPNTPLAAGSAVRTIFGAAELRRKNMYAEAAATNPLLSITDRAAAQAAQAAQQAAAAGELMNRGSGWSGLSMARANARRAGTLLSAFPLVYSSFVSTLDTWINNADLARRTRIKENANFLTWVEVKSQGGLLRLCSAMHCAGATPRIRLLICWLDVVSFRSFSASVT
jgi:hypothetical protein